MPALTRPKPTDFTGGVPKKKDSSDVIANKAYLLGRQQGQFYEQQKAAEQLYAQKDAALQAATQQLLQLQAQTVSQNTALQAQLMQQSQPQPQDAAMGGAAAALMGHAIGSQQQPQQQAPLQGLSLPDLSQPPQQQAM